MAVRYNEWKITFKTIVGNLFSGKEDSTNVPLVTNLRVDPWERYQTESTSYGEWWGKKLWVMMPAMTIMGQFLATFKEFPPSQVSGSLSVEKALEALAGGRKEELNTVSEMLRRQPAESWLDRRNDRPVQTATPIL